MLIHFCKKSNSWFKIYTWFFRLDHSKLQWLYLIGLTGESVFLTPDLVHSQYTAMSERTCSQGLSHPHHLFFVITLFTCLLPSPEAFIPWSLWVHGQRSSLNTSAETSLQGKGEGKFEDTFPHSDSLSSTFPLLPFPLPLPLYSRIHKAQESFV